MENCLIEQVPVLLLNVLDGITILQFIRKLRSFFSLLTPDLERFFLAVRNRVEVLQRRRSTNV